MHTALEKINVSPLSPEAAISGFISGNTELQPFPNIARCGDTIRLALCSPLIDIDGNGLSNYYEVTHDDYALSYTPALDQNPISRNTGKDHLLENTGPTPLNCNFNDGDIESAAQADEIVNTLDYILEKRIINGNVNITLLESSHGDLHPSDKSDGALDTSDLTKLSQSVKYIL